MDSYERPLMLTPIHRATAVGVLTMLACPVLAHPGHDHTGDPFMASLVHLLFYGVYALAAAGVIGGTAWRVRRRRAVKSMSTDRAR